MAYDQTLGESPEQQDYSEQGYYDTKGVFHLWADYPAGMESGTPGAPQDEDAPTGAPDLQANWAAAIAGLTANERDQSTLRAVADRLIAKGHKVTLAQTDSQGRNQGLIIDGVLHRVIDSSNNWTLKAGSDAWGADTGTGEATPIDPAYLAPFTDPFTQPDRGKIPDDFSYPGFEGADPFVAPTGESMMQDPGYQFRADQGRGMLESSAAAKGLLNSGGTLADIMQFGQQFASQEYGNKWDRDFRVWDTNTRNKFDTYNVNRGNAFSNRGLNDTYGQTAYDRAWQQYQDQKKTHYDNQNNPFNKLRDMANLGVGAAL